MPETKESSDMGRRREEARWKTRLDVEDIEKGGGPFYAFQKGESDLHLAVKRAAVQDLKECRWSRQQIAEGLSTLVGREVSLAQLDAMLADTKIHRMPAEWVPAWVRVTGSRRILDLLCAAAGFWVADADEHDLADLARAELERERLEKKIHLLQGRFAEKT